MRVILPHHLQNLKNKQQQGSSGSPVNNNSSGVNSPTASLVAVSVSALTPLASNGKNNSNNNIGNSGSVGVFQSGRGIDLPFPPKGQSKQPPLAAVAEEDSKPPAKKYTSSSSTHQYNNNNNKGEGEEEDNRKFAALPLNKKQRLHPPESASSQDLQDSSSCGNFVQVDSGAVTSGGSGSRTTYRQRLEGGASCFGGIGINTNLTTSATTEAAASAQAYNTMGGGGKLIGLPPSRSEQDTSSSFDRGETSSRQDRERELARGRGFSRGEVSTGTIAGGDGLIGTYGGSHHRAATSEGEIISVVAASASSPVARGSRMEPHEEVDGDSKHPSSDSRLVIQMKSDDASFGKRSSRHGTKSSASTSVASVSSSCLAAAAASALSTPRYNGPIPGSSDDPATISKDDNNNSLIIIDGNNYQQPDPTLTNFIHLLRTTHNPPLEIETMQGDGNCLFRAISLQVYGSQDMHSTVRSQCLDFLEREVDHYSHFVPNEAYEDYLERKRRDGVHGNHTEIQAMSELYNRTIRVYVPSEGIVPINIFQHNEGTSGEEEGDASNPPIRLLYMDGNHYDALIDPLVPTAGLGLGKNKVCAMLC